MLYFPFQEYYNYLCKHFLNPLNWISPQSLFEKFHCLSLFIIVCDCLFQVNLLSVVLNDAPILPEADEDVTSLLKDSPQCMAFGLFMIW